LLLTITSLSDTEITKTWVYIHRIGKTERAGNKGAACSLFSDKESYKVTLLGDYLDKLIEGEALPSRKLLDETLADSRMATISRPTPRGAIITNCCASPTLSHSSYKTNMTKP